MPSSLPIEQVQSEWRQLAQQIRTAVLLTLRQGRPFGSHAPHIFGDDWTRAYLHLSDLALHSRHLRDDPRVGLFLSEPDQPGRNPLALKRMNLQGDASPLSDLQPSYERIKQSYLERFPQSAMMFGLGDFHLSELRMHEAYLILGFGQAYLADDRAPAQWVHQVPERKPG
ncbi:MAG TPA: pyridoxamine 5'-phosphate oxidase family protein [Nitrospiraceae bacterium]|nr:pyridoxamine 5'-phosphate oxidase family protein [Nitrospiraceae bacterium]